METTCQRCWKKNPEEIHTCTPWYYFEKETTWQTVYEQLQEFLNECIIQWRQYKRIREYLYCTPIWLRNNNIHSKYYNELISYHDLFSKDSWIMEFVEWKEIYPTVANLQAHYINMCEKTEEEKVIYFLDNAIIPWISK